MKDMDIKKILNENEKLKKENRELTRMLKELKSEINLNYSYSNINNSELNQNEIGQIKKLPNDFKNEERAYNLKIEKNEEYDNFENIDDMSIISFLARSEKRVQILKSLNQGDKIPSIIGKEIGDSSHHVSKYLTSLKQRDLVICLNEEDKRFRFYRITAKGKYYLEIIEKNEYY